MLNNICGSADRKENVVLFDHQAFIHLDFNIYESEGGKENVVLFDHQASIRSAGGKENVVLFDPKELSATLEI